MPNLYQSLIYLLLVVGLGGLYLAGAGHAASLGRSCCCWCAPAPTASRCRPPTRACASRCPFIDRLQAAEAALRAQRPARRRGARCRGSKALAFERVSFAYSPERPVSQEHQLRGRRPARRSGSSAPPAPASRRWCRSCCSCASRTAGRYLVNGVPAERVRARATGTGGSPTCRRNRGCCTPRWRTTSASSAISTTRPSNGPARLARIHDDIIGWPQGYETIVGPARGRRLGRPAAAHLPGAGARGAARRCSCSTSPPARSTRTPSR